MSRPMRAQVTRYRRQLQILSLIRQAWEMRPGRRLFQLLIEDVVEHPRPHECTPHFIDDAVLEKRLEDFLAAKAVKVKAVGGGQ